MESISRLKKDWVLTPAAFAKLLAAFDAADERRAALEYEAARARLVKLFRWRNVFDAEEAADETLNRVARRLEEGEAVQNVSAFLGGVARLVVLEKLKAQKRFETSIDDAPPQFLTAQTNADAEFEDDSKLKCFNECLTEMPPETRAIVVEYYDANRGGAQIEHRKRMAARLNLEMNALRNRALRARDKLEKCIKNCLSA